MKGEILVNGNPRVPNLPKDVLLHYARGQIAATPDCTRSYDGESTSVVQDAPCWWFDANTQNSSHMCRELF